MNKNYKIYCNAKLLNNGSIYRCTKLQDNSCCKYFNVATQCYNKRSSCNDVEQNINIIEHVRDCYHSMHMHQKKVEGNSVSKMGLRVGTNYRKVTL